MREDKGRVLVTETLQNFKAFIREKYSPSVIAGKKRYINTTNFSSGSQGPMSSGYTTPLTTFESFEDSSKHEIMKGDPNENLDLRKSLVKHYNKFKSQEITHLLHYTEGSGHLNSLLWRTKGDVSTLDGTLKAHTHYLDKALKRHTTPHKLEVYSGLWHHPEIGYGKIHLTGSEYTHPAYLSTSLSQRRASRLAPTITQPNMERHKHILKIHIPQASHGAYIEQHSSSPGEQEMLLPRNSKLHIYPHPEKSDHIYYEGGPVVTHHVWRAILVK